MRGLPRSHSSWNPGHSWPGGCQARTGRTVAFVPTCLLIRHGRTASNANGTLAGWTEGVALDDMGRRQAADLAERLRGLPIRVVASSPLLRCVETAEIVVSALVDVAVEMDERVGECRYGSWTGGSLNDLATKPLWRMVQDQPSAARFPDGEMFAGESIAEMQARALQAVREIDARGGADPGPQASAPVPGATQGWRGRPRLPDTPSPAGRRGPASGSRSRFLSPGFRRRSMDHR